MCWRVDPETNAGTCTSFCDGTEEHPVCVEPGHLCTVTNGGVLILCVPKCNPLLQDCNDGEACVVVPDGFACAPDTSPADGVFGDPCEAPSFCRPGLECIDADLLPGCAGAVGCCSEYCDLTEPNECPDGLMCVPKFEPGHAPPGYEEVGLCVGST